jgi:hypothetical protein
MENVSLCSQTSSKLSISSAQASQLVIFFDKLSRNVEKRMNKSDRRSRKLN